MTEAVIPTRLARAVLRAVAAQGYDAEAVIKDIGLDFNPLAVNKSEQEKIPQTIPSSVYNTLYNRVIWLLQDEALGLNLKQRIPTGSFRIMCMCLLSCANLHSAILRANEFNTFCRNLSGFPAMNQVPLLIGEPSDKYAISYLPSSDELFEIAPKDNIIGIAACLHMWRRLLSWLIAKPIELNYVSFKAQKPIDISRLQAFFNCDLRFQQQHNAICFHKDYLSCGIHHDEESLKQFLRSAPYELTIPNHDLSGDILVRMRAIVGNNLGRNFPTIDTVAQELNMSVRTLRRRLNTKNTSYQAFKDKTRLDVASGYLNHPDLKISTIAALMGFDEPSAFHRAFKKWAGLTPGEYRQKLQLNPRQ